MKKIQILLLLIILILSSCATQKEIKRAETVKDEIQELRNLNKEKVEAGTQSPEIGKAVDSTYQKMQEKLSVLQEAVKKNPTDISQLKKLKQKSQSYQTTIETFLKLYKLETFRAFESSRFFNSGEYKIQPEDASLIMNDLDPLIDKIIEVIEKDKAVNIEVIMGVYGYTDEQEIAVGGDLYKTITTMKGTKNLSQLELNKVLSELRAKSLADLVQTSVDKRKGNEANKNHIFYNINWLGRGFEKLPFKNMEVKKVDEKRRVVTVIWGVKPILVDEE
jgi:hypothetical protein